MTLDAEGLLRAIALLLTNMFFRRSVEAREMGRVRLGEFEGEAGISRS